MTELEVLLDAVESAFVETSRGAPPWLDPHPGRTVPDEAYSRLTHPAKWRILAARTDAWLVALVASGLVVVEADANVTWRAAPGPVISRTERVIPVARGALELVIAHSRLGDVPDAGVVVGAGNPAECINWFPDCGCDACDTGSANELDHLDAHLLSIVSGSFRRLTNRGRVITVIDDGSWTATNLGGSAGRSVEEVLAHPRGWTELSGTSWVGTTG